MFFDQSRKKTFFRLTSSETLSNYNIKTLYSENSLVKTILAHFRVKKFTKVRICIFWSLQKNCYHRESQLPTATLSNLNNLMLEMLVGSGIYYRLLFFIHCPMATYIEKKVFFQPNSKTQKKTPKINLTLKNYTQTVSKSHENMQSSRYFFVTYIGKTNTNLLYPCCDRLSMC